MNKNRASEQKRAPGSSVTQGNTPGACGSRTPACALEPDPDFTDMTITADLAGIFKSAEGKREEFHHNQVEQLHLLFAVLELPSRSEVDLLRRARINEEKLRARLKEAGG